MASQRAVLKLSHQTRAGQWALRHCLGYLLSLENVSSGVSPYPHILLKYPPNHILYPLQRQSRCPEFSILFHSQRC